MTDIVKPTPGQELAEKKDWSQAMSTADLLPQQYRNKPGNLLFACEYADALGISRVHVLTSIAVINGRPSPSADLMAAMVRAHGHKLRVHGDSNSATAELIRSDDPDFTFTATWDAAKARQANLWGNKGPWSLYPAAMLRARAISEVVRMGAQEVMAGGIYTPEEMGAQVDETGSAITATAARVEQAQPAQQSTQQAHTHIQQQLGGTPVDTPAENTEPPTGLIEQVTTATSHDQLNTIYEEHKTAPYWPALKPHLTERKERLEAIASEAEEILEAEPLNP